MVKESRENSYVPRDILLGKEEYYEEILNENKLNVLILYEGKSTYTSTVKEYIDAFKNFSGHNIYYDVASDQSKCYVQFEYFDVVVIHYSLRLCLESGGCTLSPAYADSLRDSTAYKIAIIQDEYDLTDIVKKRLMDLKINAVFTCVPHEFIEKVYPKEELPDIEFFQCLTGYSPDESSIQVDIPSIESRQNKIVYRGRKLSYRYGDLGQEKKNIGERMKQICQEKNIQVDIEVDDDYRIYGKKWYKFLANSRSTLGTESGANIFDFDGTITKNVTQMMASNPDATYNDVYTTLLQEHEGSVMMNQISPKIFEAIFLRTALILFEGEYSGIVQPHKHYIPLKKDFSNVDDVLAKINDTPYLTQLTQRAYEDIIDSGKYSYQKFIRHFDYVVLNRCVFSKSRASSDQGEAPKSYLFASKYVSAKTIFVVYSCYMFFLKRVKNILLNLSHPLLLCAKLKFKIGCFFEKALTFIVDSPNYFNHRLLILKREIWFFLKKISPTCRTLLKGAVKIIRKVLYTLKFIIVYPKDSAKNIVLIYKNALVWWRHNEKRIYKIFIFGCKHPLQFVKRAISKACSFIT